MQKLFLVGIFFFVFQACNNSLKEYTLNDGLSLQLYSDGTFKQEVRLLERMYNVSGTWTGNTSEGNSFSTKIEGKGMQKEVVSTYTISNGKAILKVKE